MAVDTSEIELSFATIEKFAQENPRTWQWLVHNFSVLKDALDTSASTTDTTALEAQIAALQALLNAIQAAVDAIQLPAPFDPSGLQTQIDDLQQQIDDLPPPPLPFMLPDGADKQILTHGPGGNGDIYWTDNIRYTLAQSGDLIPVNELTADEAVLPEFMLDDDGKVMLIPIG